jgi:hypothetical protein
MVRMIPDMASFGRAPVPTLNRVGLLSRRQRAYHLNYGSFTDQVWNNRGDLIRLLTRQHIEQRVLLRPRVFKTGRLSLFGDNLGKVPRQTTYKRYSGGEVAQKITAQAAVSRDYVKALEFEASEPLGHGCRPKHEKRG